MTEDCSRRCQCDGGSVSCSSYGCHEDAECKIRNGVRDCYCERGYRGDGQTCEKGNVKYKLTEN